MRAYRESQFPITIVRPSHTYDCRMLPMRGGYTAIERMHKGKQVIVHGDGTSLWVLTHNTDFAKGFVGLLGNAHAIGQAYHITSDELLTWNQIFAGLGHAAGVEPDIVHVPSTPADAGGLLLAALGRQSPVIYLEHKLLNEDWLDFLGAGGRKTVHYDVPAQGTAGPVPWRWQPLEIGKAAVRREGSDLTVVSVGVGVHRALEAASSLEASAISAGVIDLRTVSPLDRETVCEAVSRTGRMLVVDEDYEQFGLSGELAAIALEAGLSLQYARVCTRDTIPYARALEDQVLPSTARIAAAAVKMMSA